MGNCFRRKKKSKFRKEPELKNAKIVPIELTPTVPDQVQDESEKEEEEIDVEIVEEDSDDDDEKEEINQLRRWLHYDLARFILNHVLMGIQFFRNFDEEIKQLQKENLQNDGVELKGQRLKHYQADKLMEHVGKRVVFQPKHGPLKKNEFLLHPLRSFIQYQNVEVQWARAERSETALEDQSPPYYRLKTEDVANNDLRQAGYINLIGEKEEQIYASIEETQKSKHPLSPTPESTSPALPSLPMAHSTNKIENTYDVPMNRVVNALNQLEMPEFDEEYEYTSIQSLAAERKLREVRMGNRIELGCVIPSTTFTVIKKKILPSYMSGRRTGLRGPLEEQRKYLGSENFFRNFMEVLAGPLAGILKLPADVNSIPVQGGRVVVTQGKAKNHIIPAFHGLFWPDAGAGFETKMSLYWPNIQMVRKIVNFGVHLQPLGFLQKRGQNDEFHLQWRFICPRAEEYLLLRTMQAHIHCYFFSLAIFQSFLQTDNNCLSLDQSHILHLLFWQISKKYVGWPEDRPIDKLLEFLSELQNAIKKGIIKDFFFDDRNLLESSPSKFVNIIKGQLARILENPLPYILLAIKNLKIKDFPELDMSEIFILATEKKLLHVLNPHLRPQKQERKPSLTEEDYEALRDEEKDIIWYKAKLEQERLKKEQEVVKGSTETINLSTLLEKDVDTNSEAAERREALLTKFIKHFLKMGPKCEENRSVSQAQMYYTQAKRLAHLLSEETRIEKEDLVDFYKQIKDGRERCEKLKAQPETPSDKSSNEGKKEEIKKEDSHRLSKHSRELPQLPLNH